MGRPFAEMGPLKGRWTCGPCCLRPLAGSRNILQTRKEAWQQRTAPGSGSAQACLIPLPLPTPPSNCPSSTLCAAAELHWPGYFYLYSSWWRARRRAGMCSKQCGSTGRASTTRPAPLPYSPLAEPSGLGSPSLPAGRYAGRPRAGPSQKSWAASGQPGAGQAAVLPAVHAACGGQPCNAVTCLLPTAFRLRPAACGLPAYCLPTSRAAHQNCCTTGGSMRLVCSLT